MFNYGLSEYLMLPILKEDIDSSTVAVEGFLFLRLIMWALSQETVMARKEIALVSLAYHQFLSLEAP